MGCGSSSSTEVHPLTNGTKYEAGSKPCIRGDSAVSKVTTDSGVVMENRDIPVLPAAVPNELPPPSHECIEESEADTATPKAASTGENAVQERPKSSEILEELLSQGIIPMGESREKDGGASFSIMLKDTEGVTRRPPARLESLKTQKSESVHSREEIDERMRLVEERRKLLEDERRASLRTKSARVRRCAPISPISEDEESSRSPLPQTPREATEGVEWVRETGAVGREEAGSVGEKVGIKEEEVTHVEELKAGGLLTASGELKNDSSFQHEDGEDTF
nr:stathmin domain-containing protein 1 [Nothobranchius furzeri]